MMNPCVNQPLIEKLLKQFANVDSDAKVDVTLQDGCSFKGTVVNADLILLLSRYIQKLHSPLQKLRCSSTLHPGDLVVVVTCPISLQNTITACIARSVVGTISCCCFNLQPCAVNVFRILVLSKGCLDMHMESDYATDNGIQIHHKRVIIQNKYKENLVGILHETGSKEVVIVCHGYRSCKDRIPMVNLAVAFANKGISAFRFDFAGNGDSGCSFQYWNNYREVDDLRSVMQCFEQEKRQELIRETSTPSSGSKDLVFLTQYPQPFLVQCKAYLWKQHWCHWRNLNAIRFAITVLTAAILGVVFFRKDERCKVLNTILVKLEDLLSKLGTFHSAVVFLGALNQNDVHPLVALKNTFFTVKGLLGCIYYFHMLLLRLDARLHRLNMAILSLLVIIWKLLRSNCFGQKSGESAGVDSNIFTKTCVDSAGSEGLKDHSAIDRWELVGSQPLGVDNIKQSVDYVASLLMPLYKARKLIKKVMEQTTDVEKAMAVFEFLDFKRKNKIRAFVDRLIERHMAMKTDTKSGGS
ncbi:alpha/beta hydrolases superfamily protein [Tanacetum coccineum]